MAENSNIDDIKAPLLAALGAADLALATVNELITNLRERAEETRTDTRSRVEESRARLTKLQEDLPEQLTEICRLPELSVSGCGPVMVCCLSIGWPRSDQLADLRRHAPKCAQTKTR